MTSEEVLFQMRQGLTQFVMSTYYKLTSRIGNQEAANQTLKLINDVRAEFLNKAEYNYENAIIELITNKREEEHSKYDKANEQERFLIRKRIENLDTLMYNIRKVFEEE